MTPEMSLETQKIIGRRQLLWLLNQCTPDTCTKDEVAQIMNRTHRWLEQSVTYHQAHPNSRYGNQQALFGIIQGGIF